MSSYRRRLLICYLFGLYLPSGTIAFGHSWLAVVSLRACAAATRRNHHRGGGGGIYVHARLCMYYIFGQHPEQEATAKSRCVLSMSGPVSLLGIVAGRAVSGSEVAASGDARDGVGALERLRRTTPTAARARASVWRVWRRRRVHLPLPTPSPSTLSSTLGLRAPTLLDTGVVCLVVCKRLRSFVRSFPPCVAAASERQRRATSARDVECE